MQFYQPTIDRWEPVRPGMDPVDLDPVTEGHSDMGGVDDEIQQILRGTGEVPSDYDIEAIADEVSGYWDSPMGLRWYFITKFEEDFWEAVEAAYEG